MNRFYQPRISQLKHFEHLFIAFVRISLDSWNPGLLCQLTSWNTDKPHVINVWFFVRTTCEERLPFHIWLRVKASSNERCGNRHS